MKHANENVWRGNSGLRSLMAKNTVKLDSFTTADNRPRLFEKAKPERIKGSRLKVGEDNHLNLKDLCELAAHSDVKVTNSYLAGHKPVF